MGILDEDVQRVREATDLVALISEHVALKRVGRRFSGLCPFHTEKTPSFSVNPEMQVFHCFGCQKSGDAITFLREVEHLDFVETIERLAARANITLRYDDAAFSQDRKRRLRLHEAVQAAIDFYTKHLGFEVRTSAAPAFADVTRGNLRLLLSGPASSAGRPMPDGDKPGPGGWNRIHFIVADIAAEVDRLRNAGLSFRNDILSGPGGSQILLEDPSGNVIELFQPAGT